MYLRLCRGALPLGAALLVACAPTLDWRDVRPAGTRLLLLMPCKPNTQERKVTLAAAPVRLALLACDAGGQTWALVWADVGDPARVGPALAALATAAAANLRATATPLLAQVVPGATPQPQAGLMRVEGKRPDGRPLTLHAALFAQGTQVFQASLLGPAAPNESREVFFDAILFER